MNNNIFSQLINSVHIFLLLVERKENYFTITKDVIAILFIQADVVINKFGSPIMTFSVWILRFKVVIHCFLGVCVAVVSSPYFVFSLILEKENWLMDNYQENWSMYQSWSIIFMYQNNTSSSILESVILGIKALMRQSTSTVDKDYILCINYEKTKCMLT